MNPFAVAAPLLRQIPPELQEKVLTGALRLTGSIIRDPRTGRIAGFLQEAGPLSGPLASVLKTGVSTTLATGNPALGTAAAGAQLLGQVASLAQGEAIRAGVKRVDGKLDAMNETLGSIGQGVDLLQNLGIANLALGAAGLGVSVVGFGIMSAKLDGVQRAIHAIGDHLDTMSAKIDRIRQDTIDADFVEIHSLCQLYEEGWGFGDRGRSEQQWLRISQEARTFQDRFAWRAREILTATPHAFPAADAMIDASALASGLRVASLVACNEGALAASIAAESGAQIEALTGTIGLAELAMVHVTPDIEAGTHDFELAMVQAREAARPMLRKFRDREAGVATRTAPLALLDQRGIAPREWLEAARSEKEAPALLLKTDDADEIIADA